MSLIHAVYSSPPSAAYIHQWTGSALLQVMACHLFGTKPLPEPMTTYCQLDLKEQTSVKLESKYKSFIHENVFENFVCEMAILYWGRWVNQFEVIIGAGNNLKPNRQQTITLNWNIIGSHNLLVACFVAPSNQLNIICITGTGWFNRLHVLMVWRKMKMDFCILFSNLPSWKWPICLFYVQNQSEVQPAIWVEVHSANCRQDPQWHYTHWGSAVLRKFTACMPKLCKHHQERFKCTHSEKFVYCVDDKMTDIMLYCVDAHPYHSHVNYIVISSICRWVPLSSRMSRISNAILNTCACLLAIGNKVYSTLHLSVYIYGI